MILQVLFTSPGERVNRPDFGCGLKQLVFAPASEAVAAATQLLVKGALQKWLEGEIDVEEVAIEARTSGLRSPSPTAGERRASGASSASCCLLDRAGRHRMSAVDAMAAPTSARAAPRWSATRR